MKKTSAIEYYERILMLRLQLFLRVTAFAGTLLIFSTYYRRILGKPLAHFGLQESYATALLTVFIASAAAATIDFPIRFAYRRIKRFATKIIFRRRK